MSFEEDFCGGYFWDQNVTWYTEDPDFTPCFHKTVLAWTPTVIFVFFAAFEVRKHLQSDRRRTPWNFYYVSSLLVTLCLVGVTIVELVFVGLADNDDDDKTAIFPVDYVTPVVYCVTYVMSFLVTLLSVKRGIRTSPSQFFLYLTSTICGIITFR